MRISAFAVIISLAMALAAALCTAAEPTQTIAAENEQSTPEARRTQGVSIRKFIVQNPEKFDRYLRELKTPELLVGGVGFRLVDAKHSAAELISMAHAPSDSGAITAIDTTVSAVTDHRVKFVAPCDLVEVTVNGDQRTEHRWSEQDCTVTFTIQSQTDHSENDFRFKLEIMDGVIRKPNLVELKASARTGRPGFQATADIEMQVGQVLLLRGAALTSGTPKAYTNGRAAPAPLYVVSLISTEQLSRRPPTKTVSAPVNPSAKPTADQ